MKHLVHCITNYVAMNFTANSLLAVGVTPIMSAFPDEMEELVGKCDALLVNIGCLDNQQIEAMKIAVSTARECRKPWALDPVAVGLTKQRTEVCKELIGICVPDIIRGNKHEIDAIRTIYGVEGSETELAKRLGCVIVTSGATDLITDGSRCERITLGSPMMTEVTAMGCVSTAISAAYMAKGFNAFDAACKTMLLMGRAGEKAAEICNGTGSFKQIFIDNIYKMKCDE